MAGIRALETIASIVLMALEVIGCSIVWFVWLVWLSNMFSHPINAFAQLEHILLWSNTIYHIFKYFSLILLCFVFGSDILKAKSIYFKKYINDSKEAEDELISTCIGSDWKSNCDGNERTPSVPAVLPQHYT